ncbi:MAG TPA: adenylate/guanylate cyclase domain-containing protein [Anaeromyxobacteraceae bacterium]|nr:adenylate/guanylate cyclase domain-containing protein [Anaeromyxobacteraceae bacterium]
MPSPSARKLRAALLAGSVAGLLGGALALARPEPLEAAERVLYDVRAARTAPPAGPNVALVAIDDETIRLAGGTYPIPRSALAALLDEARRAGAESIALDLVLVDPLEGSLAEENAALEEALRRGRVVLAAAAAEDPGHPGRFLLQPPLPRFAAAAAALGVVSQRQDLDGKVRALRHAFPTDQGLLASLPRAAAVAAGPVKLFDGPEGPDGRVLVRWTRPPAPGAAVYPEVSGATLLRAALAREGEGAPPPPEALRPLDHAVVVLSSTATAAKDKRPTPVNPEAVGGEVIATAVDGLLNDHHVRRLSPAADAAAALGLALASALLAALVSLAGVGPGAALALSLLAVAATLGGAWSAALWLLARGVWVAAAAPLLAGGAAALSAQLALLAVERRDRRLVHDALGRYTSPALVRTLLARPELLDQFGGARQELTVSFSDLRGFTTVSESLPPERLVELLNEYLSAMTEVVELHGGYVDKYVGDAIMAIWGAPVPAADHAARACRAALDMRDRLAELRPGWRERFGVELHARTGLNTAPAVAGHVGSRRKASYTVMGDGVNLASRLEGANKAYGTAILVGEGTRAAAGDGLAFRSVDRVRVKGKTQGVAIFELVGRTEALGPDALAALAAWEGAVADYRARRFQAARDAFAALAAARPDDEAARLYLERCGERLASPPPEGWDGVHELHEK